MSFLNYQVSQKRAKQTKFNNIFKFLMTHNVSGHYPSSCLYLEPPVVFIFQNNVSETGFCLRLQVEPTQLGPIDRDSPYLSRHVPAPRQGTEAW
jgi:hypothetical protein